MLSFCVQARHDGCFLSSALLVFRCWSWERRDRPLAPASKPTPRRKPMRQSRHLLFAATALALVSQAPRAQACGGFFCGRAPVDQTAERILFEVGDESVTMTTQISYNGAAEDFAWVLPLFEVPDPDSLAVFPQRALTGLDAATGPIFYPPCGYPEAAAG